MIERPIQNEMVPALGFGTFELTGCECRKAVADALSIGYRHIDTARMYGNEEEVGYGMQDAAIKREDIFLTTKIWYTDLNADNVRRELKTSLRELQTDYVDLLLIHWPNPDIPLKETLEAMMDLQQQGKARHIGVSNFPTAIVEEAMAIAPIFCNQVEYHPYLGQPKLIDQARANDLLLTAYCPLAKGRVFKDETLEDIGRQHGKTPAQVALRWLVQQNNVAAIPRSREHQHRQYNFAIFDFALSNVEMTRIVQLDNQARLIDPAFAPAWDE